MNKNILTKKLIIILLISIGMIHYSYAESLKINKKTQSLIDEAMVSKDGQKFFEIGYCYSLSNAAVESRNRVLEIRVFKMLDVIDIDLIRNDIVKKLDASCPKSLDRNKKSACLIKQPLGMQGFLAGLTEGKKAAQGLEVFKLSELHNAYCGKHIDF
jgi:hypothetical protein